MTGAVLSLPLNRAHVLAQIERLLRVYKRPDHAPADPMEFATDYAQICGALTAAQFTGAVDAYLSSESKFFPKPGELLALGRGIARGTGPASSLHGQYDEWERNAWQDPGTGLAVPCPVCLAKLRPHVVRINADGSQVERFMVLHNAALHWKAEIGFSGWAQEGTGGGRYEHQIVDARPTVVPPEPPPAGPTATDADVERAAIRDEGA